MTLTLHILHNNEQTRDTYNQDVVKIGKLKSSHVCLDDDTVARMHAVIERENDAYQIIDLGSATGTFVNGSRVDKISALDHGDLIQIGPSRILVQVDDKDIDLDVLRSNPEPKENDPPRSPLPSPSPSCSINLETGILVRRRDPDLYDPKPGDAWQLESNAWIVLRNVGSETIEGFCGGKRFEVGTRDFACWLISQDPRKSGCFALGAVSTPRSRLLELFVDSRNSDEEALQMLQELIRVVGGEITPGTTPTPSATRTRTKAFVFDVTLSLVAEMKVRAFPNFVGIYSNPTIQPFGMP